MQVRPATVSQAPALVALINAAFQVERFFIDTDRINLGEVEAFFRTGCFLIAEEAGDVTGCVYVEQRGEHGYFGLLSVQPERQKMGIGNRLIAAAEEHCRAMGCTAMDLQIVNLRHELPAYYQRLGYAESGRGEFPTDVPTKLPCHFVKMSKPL